MGWHDMAWGQGIGVSWGDVQKARLFLPAKPALAALGSR
jgi:hypothetical protein